MITIKEYTEEVVKAVAEKLKLSSMEATHLIRVVKELENYKKYKNKIINKTYTKIRNGHLTPTPLKLHVMKENERKIVETAVDVHNIDLYKFIENDRKIEMVDCRRQIMYIFRKKLGYSLNKVANVFYKDHSSVIHNIRKHEDLIDTDRVYTRLYNQMVTALVEKKLIEEN